MSPLAYRTESLILRSVTENDLAEVARTWPSDHHPLTDAEARTQIARMQRSHEKNAAGRVFHLCLAVCGSANPGMIRGWCGLDGSRSPSEPEVFVLLDSGFRHQGFGTQCLKELLRIAVEEYALRTVHGGCSKDNTASARAMEKAGMALCGHEENGDPRYRFTAGDRMYKLKDYAEVARAYVAMHGGSSLRSGRDLDDFSDCWKWVHEHNLEHDYRRFEEERLGPLKKRQSMIRIDADRTREYYRGLSDADLCDCEGCRNYRQMIRQSCPMAANYLSLLGIDIEKPFNVSYLEPINGRLLYIDCDYAAFGECDLAFIHQVDGLEISHGFLYPDPGIEGPYVVLQINSVELPFSDEQGGYLG
ncbi:MAG: GNAT family N-acetyltransferase [Clostridia bacterium]|nr:GNAT family N-acetyltransferase [Clostridia bacterium]